MRQRNRVGLGTFPFANVFSKVSEKEAKAIVERFLDLGGYYIDTAPLYGFGEVEEILGEALSEFSREKYFLMSKCGIVGIEENEKRKSSKYDDVILECYKSLKRLKTDYIDLYFVHSPDPETAFDETVSALKELKDQGKIKQIGVSNVSLEELKAYNTTGLISFVQNRFSLINRSIDEAINEYLEKNDIKLVPYNVLEQGQLTSRFLEEVILGSGDVRAGLESWRKKQLEVVLDWVKDELEPIAESLGVEISQLAISWVLHQPYISFPIVGATSVEQVESNMKADGIKLTKSDLVKIDKAYNKLHEKILREDNLDVHEFRGLNEKYY